MLQKQVILKFIEDTEKVQQANRQRCGGRTLPLLFILNNFSDFINAAVFFNSTTVTLPSTQPTVDVRVLDTAPAKRSTFQCFLLDITTEKLFSCRNSTFLNSKVLSVTIKPPPTSLSAPVVVEFSHLYNVSNKSNQISSDCDMFSTLTVITWLSLFSIHQGTINQTCISWDESDR